jgi:hypothetical protein
MALGANGGVSNNKALSFNKNNDEVSLMTTQGNVDISGLTDANPSKKMIDIDKLAAQTFDGRGRFADSIA